MQPPSGARSWPTSLVMGLALGVFVLAALLGWLVI
jgi:hypothetical protein